MTTKITKLNPAKTKALCGLFTIGIILLPCSETRAADVTSTWDGSNGLWSDIAKWSNSPAAAAFPNNGTGGLTYEAILNGGTITLDLAAQAITVSRYIQSNGTLTLTGGGGRARLR